MKTRILTIFLIFISFLNADENPFKVEKKEKMIVPQEFQERTFKFNSDARILKSITFHYVKADGSEDKLSVDINKSVNWHDSYVLTHSKTPEPSKILDVSVTIPQNTSQETNKTTEVDIPLQIAKIYDFISYTVYKNKIKLNTQDDLISDFSVGNPSKIIIDFKSTAIYPTKNIRLKNSIFKRIDFGSHKGYYRLVIYLDGVYNYEIQKDSTGYMVHLS
ncbi:AMIN domain-containing protein [Campylobacter taeniopygiae]|uniref:AMIN domain-containing protein n=1 Tax=Campylobacter taeniopygiae TaxID=2510188 RepID=A0ABY2TKX0_9BACT|nr:AMIN domain-containing protein [Campylobacter taeniopygiae]TKX33935.1 AMIN domain-containing protein [Campylobacter taeniopygiae]